MDLNNVSPNALRQAAQLLAGKANDLERVDADDCVDCVEQDLPIAADMRRLAGILRNEADAKAPVA
jgi:hypothetical protein